MCWVLPSYWNNANKWWSDHYHQTLGILAQLKLLYDVCRCIKQVIVYYQNTIPRLMR